MVEEPVPKESSPEGSAPGSSPGQGRNRPAPLGMLVGGLSLALTSIVRAFDRTTTAGRERPTTAAAEKSEHFASQSNRAYMSEDSPIPGARPPLPSEADGAKAATRGESGPTGPAPAPSSDHSLDLIRAGLVGLLLQSEKQATRAVTVLNRGIQETADLVPGSGLPGSRRVRSALTREATKMEERGRAEVDRLAAIGRAEEEQVSEAMEAAARDLAAKMVDEAVSLSIERIANSPEIHEVIRLESAGVVEDLLEGVRAKCAYADERGERGARRLFRRGKPRPVTGAGVQEGPVVAVGQGRGSEALAAAAAPLESSSGTEAGSGVLDPAGFVSRAVALVIDAVIVTIAAAVGGYMISATLAALRPGIFGDHLVATPPVLGAALFPVYFLFCWTVFGRTIGMAIIGLKVLTIGGARVSFVRAVLRYVGYLVSTAVVFLGFLWVLIDDRRLGWLDHIARTQVVRAPGIYAESEDRLLGKESDV